MNDKFENPNKRKASYWNMIVKAFEEKGYKVTIHDLINKWNKFACYYNRNVNKLKKTGESAITWKYFTQMHEVFAEKKSVNPVKLSLGSTFKPETLTLADESSDSTCDENAYVQNIPQKRKKINLPIKKNIRFQENVLRIIEEKNQKHCN